MNVVTPNFWPALPEIFVLVMGCIILLSSLFFKRQNVVYYLTQLTLIGAAILTWQQHGQNVVTFFGMYQLDNLAIILKLIIYFTSFMAFVYARRYVSQTNMAFNEYYILGIFAVLGMMVVVSANNFLMLFLGLELFSLPLYALIALRRESVFCTEAALKYFIIGALASGMFLYGISLLYGATGSLDLKTVAVSVNKLWSTENLILVAGVVFIVAGLAFKLGAVPFHMWVPDVYEGAPTSVVVFLGSAAKIAALGLLFRILIEALPDLVTQWQQMLTVVAVLSMAIGNLAAIVQSNIKRMLAYSSIAHMGYMSLGLVAATPDGYAAALFYMITYTIMTLGAFGLITMISRSGFEADRIDDLRGLNSRNPWLALMMLIVMFSLAGVPPIVGFMAKVAVLEALIRVNMVWLAILALLFAIIGAYYYIRVVKVMYFEKPIDKTPVSYARDSAVAFSINSLLVLVLGMFPGFLLNICKMVFVNI